MDSFNWGKEKTKESPLYFKEKKTIKFVDKLRKYNIKLLRMLKCGQWNPQNLQKEFEEFLKNAGPRLVVVNFTAKWCGPCKMIRPVLHELAVRYENVLFCMVDVDLAEDVALLCNIVVVPTFQLFIKGEKIFEITSANAKKLEEKIKELM